ncbi:MAG: 2,3-bisphosphoglycerate-independent phosphoglycerate mutase [Nanoarchaeota archaeon]|nr:2,3-bisphosphoglycerate-independent phosphoglycerate mutase [Nanoarchaeota archaeon]
MCTKSGAFWHAEKPKVFRAQSKKILFIILDGVADLPVKKLGGLTPLEAAKTPALDKIAEKSQLGIMRVIDNNLPPETDTAVLSMFGYNPLIWSRGRGPLEAKGIGFGFKEGKDLVLRCNFASQQSGKITDTEAQRIESGYAKKLAQDIRKNVKLKDATFDFVHDLNYRALLVLRSKRKLSENISSTHPGYERKKYEKAIMELPKALSGNMKTERCKPMDNSESARFSASLVNDFIMKAERILKNHKINIERKKKGLNEANAILTRGAGTALPKLGKIKGKWLCIADTPAEKGIAKLLGMKTPDLPEPLTDRLLNADGEIEKAVKADMKIRLRMLAGNADNYDSFYLHFKGADPFGHRNMPEQKRFIIESMDRHFFKPLSRKINLDDFLVCVTSDHTTACELRTHTADPVPVLIRAAEKFCAPGCGDGMKFCEKNCGKGSLGIFRAGELMGKLLGK